MTVIHIVILLGTAVGGGFASELIDNFCRKWSWGDDRQNFFHFVFYCIVSTGSRGISTVSRPSMETK